MKKTDTKSTTETESNETEPDESEKKSKSLSPTEIQTLASCIYRNDYEALLFYLRENNANINHDAIFSLIIPEAMHLQIPIPKDQLTLLHIAAAGDALDVFILLEQNGFSVNVSSAASYLPIHYACICESVEVASYILTKYPEMCTIEPPVEFHLLYLTATSGNTSIMKLLFDGGVNFRSERNRRNNPIRKAVESGSIDCLKYLLTHCQQPPNKNDQYSLSMLAAINMQPQAVDLIVQFDPHPITYCAPIDKKTLLDLCCFCGEAFKPTIIKLLNRADNIEPPYANCKGPAQWICIAFDLDIAKAFFKHHINVNRIDEEGKTGFHYLTDKLPDRNHRAADQESIIINIMQLFLQHGFDINIYTKTKPPISCSILECFISSIKKSYNVISFLIENGANIMAKNKDGIPLYDIVMKKSDRKLKEIFQKAREHAKFQYETTTYKEN